LGQLVEKAKQVLKAVEPERTSTVLGPLTERWGRGLDMTRPAGAAVFLRGGQWHALGFLPVKDVPELLTGVREWTGAQGDAHGGIARIERPLPLFFRIQSDWVFLSTQAIDLSALPEDPTALLRGLDCAKYDCAARVNLQAIPLGRLVPPATPGPPLPLRPQTSRSEVSLPAELQGLVEQVRFATFGISVDGPSRTAHVELALAAAADSELLRMLGPAGAHSHFSGVRSRSADLSCAVRLNLGAERAAGLQAMLTRASTAGNNPGHAPTASGGSAVDVQTRVLDTAVQLCREALEGGQIDAAAGLAIYPGNSAILLAAAVHDEQRLRDCLGRLYHALRNNPNAKDLQVAVHDYRGARFVSLALDLKAGAARQLLGDKPVIVLGQHGTDFYFVIGGDMALERAKRIHNQSRAGSGGVVPAAELSFRFGALTKIAGGSQPASPQRPAGDVLSRELLRAHGRDRASLTLGTVPGGATLRLDLEEFYLQFLAAVCTAALATAP
jgi:hypothetical protein